MNQVVTKNSLILADKCKLAVGDTVTVSSGKMTITELSNAGCVGERIVGVDAKGKEYWLSYATILTYDPTKGYSEKELNSMEKKTELISEIRKNPKCNNRAGLGGRNYIPTPINLPFRNGNITSISVDSVIFNYPNPNSTEGSSPTFNETIYLVDLDLPMLLLIKQQLS